MSAASPPRRPFTDTQLGMLLFLAAETMFLGALASSLILLRTAAEPAWPPAHTVLPAGHGLLSAFLLLLLAMVAYEGTRRGTRGWLALTAGAALLPAASVGMEVLRLSGPDLGVARHNLFALYGLCNALLLLHLLGLALWCAACATRSPARGTVEGLALFAHFLAGWAMLQHILFFWT